MYACSRLFTFIFVLLAITGLTQTATLKGTIIDENGRPVPDVEIYYQIDKTKGTVSDQAGKYEIQIPAYKKIDISFSHASYTKQRLSITLYENEIRVYDPILIVGQTGVEVVINDTRVITLDMVPKIDIGSMPLFTGVEGAIKLYGMGVTSNNEMSSTYNVRGGNYDENLIYVNNIEIYRPLLVRSGQQEGLSFINPDLVDNINFSSGGFESRYGDKLSSVLDITYRKPDSAAGTVTASLLGTNLHFEGRPSSRFNYLAGFRYRSNSYLLNSLNTQGDYKPFFADGQLLMNYYINDEWKLSFLGHFSRNKYHFIPESRTTEFGSINEALRLTVYFDGQEINEFNTSMGAITLENFTKKRKISWISSAFRSNEDESFTVMGQYRLEELERDLGSDNFGEVAFLRGVGTYLNHARNRLDVTVFNSKLIGEHILKNTNHKIFWGAKFQGEIIKDTMSEWQMIDSAGYNIPQAPDDVILLNDVIKSSADLFTYRGEGYVQHNYRKRNEFDQKYGDTIVTRVKEFNLSSGVRANYWTLNNQTVVSPRIRATYFPGWWKYKDSTWMRRNVSFRAAAGFYYQPPFYRELRDIYGVHNYSLRAQQSIHFILGNDVLFKMWGRNFLFSTEAYFKYLKGIIPYEIDNVRIRYYAKNNADGYATGIDFRLNGEFIKGIQSWATLSVMKTAEDIYDDHYQEKYNAAGDLIVPGITLDQTVVDSADFYPGYIPRPADQRVNFTIFFQDEMPKWPEYKVHLSFIFGSGLPFGPPGYDRYKDVNRMPPYRRVDIGFSRQFLTHKDKLRKGSKLHKLNDLWLSLEVFNLLGIDNTISYIWVEDAQGLQYAVPNYLTSRRINLKLMVKF